MNESGLTRNILRALRERGGFWFKTHGSAYQMAGLPDIIGCYNGWFVALEVKIPGGESKTTERQRHILSSISSNGGYSRVVSSKAGALEALDALSSREV